VIGNPAHFASRPRKIIHIDIDPSSISKRVKVDIPIVGDEGRAAGTDRPAADGRAWPRHRSARAVVEADRRLARQDCLKFDRESEIIKPQYVVEKAWELTDGDAFILRRRPAPDVGRAVLPFQQAASLDQLRRPRHDGRRPAAAMGVKMAHPDDDVLCITGEGSIQMCIQELSTCLQYDTPVKIISLNNRYLGMVRQWQEIEYSKRYSHSYMDALPDFVKLAEAYGHVGMRIERLRMWSRRCGGAAPEGPHRVPGLPDRSDRKRLADGPGRQGHHRDAARLGRPVTARRAWSERPPSRRAARHRAARGRVNRHGHILEEANMRHIISVLLENEPGALSRVVGLFSARGYNIET
jgi:hypothetical protein